MALAYRASPTTALLTGVGGSITVTKQTGTASGDVIFIWCAANVNSGGLGTVSCTGFTAVSGSGNTGLLYRTADGTEGSTFTVSGTTLGTNNIVVTLVTISGGILDTVGTLFQNATSSSTVPITGITIAGSSEWGLAFAACRNNSSTLSSSLTGFTEQVNYHASSTQAYFLDNESIASGATGTETVTLPASANLWQAGILAAVKPAGPSVAGAVSALTTVANAGTVSASSSAAGPAATLTLAALAGSVVAVTGPTGAVAALTLAALPGTISTTVGPSGVLAALTLTANPGHVYGNNPRNPWYGNELTAAEADFEVPNVP